MMSEMPPAVGQLQLLLESRGWSNTATEPEEHLRPDDYVWEFGTPFSSMDGEEPHDDNAPRQATCHIREAEDPTAPAEEIALETAGNWQGCDEHRPREYAIAMTSAELEYLPAVLDQIEQHAQTLDLQPLLECLRTGPCAEQVRQRVQQRQAILDWHTAMHDAYETMDEQQRDALHSWEIAHIDGHSVGTSDWPGWRDLIGSPPWYAR